MSNFANGIATKLYYVQEDATGALPTSPAWKPIRFVSEDLSRDTAQIPSNEIRGDRQMEIERQGTYSTKGTIAAELGFASHYDLLEAAFQGTWTANVLKIGTTRRTFAILERHTDKSLDYIYRGCEVASFGLTAAINARVALTFGMVGKANIKYTVGTDTFTTASDADPFVTTDGVFSEGGATSGIITELSLSLENGTAPAFALGSRAPYDLANGMAKVGGSLSAYLTDAALYDKHLNETQTTLSQMFTDGINTITFALGKVAYIVANKGVSGPGAIIPKYTFSAGVDNSGNTISVTRSS